MLEAIEQGISIEDAVDRDKIRFLGRPCGSPDIIRKPHSSHCVAARGHVVWCVSCGAWSSKHYKQLRAKCLGQPWTALQQMALNRLAKGEGPPGIDMDHHPAKTVDIDAFELEVEGEPEGGLWAVHHSE